MASEPVLSVIVTLYNTGKYIEKCLRSILDQDFRDLEVIVVNDCSTDNGPQIVQNIAKNDKRVRIINNSKNIGQALSNNVALDAVLGKYIAFVDADDWIEQGAYTKLIKKIQARNSDLCLFGRKKYYENEKKFCDDPYYDYSALEEKLNINSDIKSWPEEIFMRYASWGKIYNKKFLKDNSLKFLDISLGEDVPFSVRCLLLANNISICNESLYIYRIHGASKMQVKRNTQHANAIINFIGSVKEILYETKNYDRYKYQFIDFIIGQKNFYLKNSRDESQFKIALENGLNIYFPKKYNKNTDNIDVSIIMSVYNGEKFIKEALDSALTQDYVNTEIICVNDGSNDRTAEILNGYVKKYINVMVITQTNRGLAASRNRAMELAKGKFFQFLDCDDTLAINAVAQLFDFAETNLLDMCSFSGINLVNGKFLKNNYWEYLGIPDIYINNSFKSEKIFNYFQKLPVSSCLTIYRAEFIKSINNKFPEGLFFEDNVFFLRSLFQSKKFGILKKYLYYRRMHPKQITKMRDKTVFDKFLIFRKCYDIINQYYSKKYALQYINKMIEDLLKLRLQLDKSLYDNFDKNMLELCNYSLKNNI